MIDLDKLAAIVERRAHYRYERYEDYERERDELLYAAPALIAELRQAREDVRRLREAVGNALDDAEDAASQVGVEYGEHVVAIENAFRRARSVLAETEGSRG